VKSKAIYLGITAAFCQLLAAQTFEPHNSINFGSVNDGRDVADGITWYRPEPRDYD